MTRGDKILIASILLIVLVFFMIGEFERNDSEKKLAVVRIEGEVYKKILLETDKTIDFEFNGPIGISKVRLIDGQIKMLESPCKDKICIKQGNISKGGQTIVCVPNQVSISIEEEDELDEISR